MHSALLVIKPNDKISGAREHWSTFLGIAESAIQHSEGIETLADGCWLIRLENGASLLARLVHLATERSLHHQILFFENEPQWVQPPLAAK